MNPPSDFEYVGAIHAHSVFSDGSGTVEQIIVAAEGTGLDFLVLTDHNTLRARDEGWEGWHDDLLLIVGDEVSSRSGHCLALGIHTHVSHRQSPHGILHDIRRQGGLSLIAHPHGRYRPLVQIRDHSWRDWTANAFDGIELWSYMFDWASSFHYARFGKHYRNPDQFITGPFTETVKLWDRLCATRRVVAIGGVDVHARKYAPLPFVVFPYRDCFRTIRTHVLTDRALAQSAPEDSMNLLEHIGAGHAFLAYDFLSDATGTRFAAPDSGCIMGDEQTFTEPVLLRVDVPVEANLLVLRDGAPWQSEHGRRWEGLADTPGVYRLEARLHGRPWLFTNPIYLRDPAA